MTGASIGAERWAALRALFEGEFPAFPLLGGASGLRPDTIRRRAAREGWRAGSRMAGGPEPVVAPVAENGGGAAVAADGEAAGSLEERLARVMERLLGEVEEIGRAAAVRGRVLDKKRIDALWSMIRTLEKFEDFARERGRAAQTGRDGEIGDVLRRIDARIVELARAYAEELGAGERVGPGSGADP